MRTRGRPNRKEARLARQHFPRFQMPPADRWYERTIPWLHATPKDIVLGAGGAMVLVGTPALMSAAYMAVVL